ncbi:MAG: hypothetical protein AB7S26_26305 [Sandaracinaceae bacterium]
MNDELDRALVDRALMDRVLALRERTEATPTPADTRARILAAVASGTVIDDAVPAKDESDDHVAQDRVAQDRVAQDHIDDDHVDDDHIEQDHVDDGAREDGALDLDEDVDDVDRDGDDDEPWLDHVVALREQTSDARGRGDDTRARVVAGTRRGRTFGMWAAAAVALLVVFVGAPEALAATGWFPRVSAAVDGAERYVASALGLREEDATVPTSRRPDRSSRAPAPSTRPTVAAPVPPAPVTAAEPVDDAVSGAPIADVTPIVAPRPVVDPHASRRDPVAVEPRVAPRVAPRRHDPSESTPPPGEPAPSTIEPEEPDFDRAEHDAFEAADRAHTAGDPTRAIAAWDAYIAAYPDGRYAIEARYNRALALVRAGREADALRALEPFEAGVRGGYRQREASALAARLRERLDAP